MKETRFKDTELCLIPEDWNSGTFQDFLATFSSGATPYRGIPDNFKGDVRWISSGELNYNTIVETIEHISKEAVVRTNLKMHQPGTFLMAITGLEAAGTRGRCAIVGKPSTTNQSCLAINSTGKMGTDFLYWFYNFWSETLAFKYAQGTKQQSFTAEIVRKLPIYCPRDKSEQTRIATALSNIDALISELGRLIEKKRAIKQGAMQQLLTGKKRLKGFTEPWVEKKLGEVGITIRGVSFKPELSSVEKKYQFIPLLRSNNIFDYKLNRNDLVYVDKSCVSGNQIMQDKDVLICAANGSRQLVGKSAIYHINEPTTFGAFMCVFRCFEGECHEFFSYILQSIDYKRQLDDILTGSAINNLNGSQIENLRFLIPSLTQEQTAIASVLTSMDDEISALESKKAKYEQIKQGMMQQLLTGKIRLID